MAKFYAVRKGEKTGIYTTWAEAEAQVKKYSGAEYKSFSTEEDARAYMDGKEIVKKETNSKTTQNVEAGNIISRPFTPDESLDEYYEVHSDGGERPKNSGLIGYGYVVVDKNQKIVEEGYGYDWNQTNNVAELMGAIEGIKAVERVQKSENAKVYFVTDSTYVYYGFANDLEAPRYEKWEKNGWKNSSGQVANLELVQELYELGKKHNLECIPRAYNYVTKKYIKMAHGSTKEDMTEAGLYKHPYNKICDRLANIGVVDAVEKKNTENNLVRLIENGEKVKEIEDREYNSRKIIDFHQKAPFYVADLDEQRHGRVLDVDGKEAKVN